MKAACLKDNIEIIKLLIEKGDGVNAKDSMNHTAMMFAETQERGKIIKLLKKAGAKE